MPEIILELSLNRSSGVLAGIVASLAQAGIELKSQKLRRASEGRGGWLTIVGAGDAPEPAALAERLNGNGGVEKLMRIIVDGEATLAEGKPLADQIQPGDIAELSAGSDTGPDEVVETPDLQPDPEQTREVPTAASDIEDLPILSEPEAVEDSAEVPTSPRREDAAEIVRDPAEQDLADALTSGGDAAEPSTPDDFSASTSIDEELAADIRNDEDSEAGEASSDDEGNAVPVGALLRRRRRRRR